MRLDLPFRALLSGLIAVGCFVGCSAKEAPAERDLDQTSATSQLEAEGGEGGSFGGLADTRTQNRAAAPAAAVAEDMKAKKEMSREGSPMDDAAPQRKDAAPGGAANKPKPSQQDPTAGMYIIRRANLTVQVPDVKTGIQKVSALVKGAGGFVAESGYEATEGQTPSARMTLRVPTAKFDAMLETLGGVGTVFARNVESEDVTLQFVDTQSRIRNLQKEEVQILNVLKRTGKLLDVLEVERELARVRGEIEQSQGRIRQLANLVGLATIEVTLSEKVQVLSSSPWAALPAAIENAWQDTERALAGAMAWAARTGIWLVAYVLPLAIPLICFYFIAGYFLRAWLVGSRKIVPEAWFQRFWLGLGLALISLWYPPLAGMIVLAAVAGAVLAGLGAFVTRFFVRKRELD